MKDINTLFFELIRVSIGTQDSFSRLPSAREWSTLYMMAEKQSLIGVCFAGLQRLGANADDGFARIGMSEMQYLTWMGQAVQIQQRNEVMNRQCVALQARLSADGFRSCILKGQGVGQLYAEHLHGLRQSGDIDVWISCEGNLAERRKRIIEYARKYEPEAKAFIHHVDCKLFEETETEFHYLPSWFNSPFSHHRFVKWCEEQMDEQMTNMVGSITMPSTFFNSVYMLAHISQHLFQEGIGLRQLMDYYFVLNSEKADKINRQQWHTIISALHMNNLACAIMWVLHEIFGLQESKMPCEPIESEGKFLLSEIMQAGNFGMFDKRIERNGETGLALLITHTKRNMHFFTHYPSETLWSPFWKIWHWTWRKSIN